MKRASLVKIIALMLVLCMLLSSCSVLEGPIGNFLEKIAINVGKDDDEPKQPVDDGNPDENGNEGNPDDGGNVTPVCQHTSTKVINVKDATCVVTGYTGDTVCSACGELIAKGNEIPVTEHTFDDGIITKNPTCIATGTYTYTCTGCAITKSDVIPTVAHSDEYHDALDGTHKHTCATCTAVSEYAEHTPVNDGEYHEATCTEMAYTVYTCSVCDGVYRIYDEAHDAIGHSYSDEWNTVEATCRTSGKKSHSCTVCGDEEVVTIEATPDIHNYVFAGYEPAPTCAEDGLAIYRCKDCGEFGYNKTASATGLHNWRDLENTGDGWVRKQCDGCEKIVANFDASTVKEAEVKAESIPTDVPFEVTTEKAAIEFPTDVIGQITGGTDVKIGADVLTDEAKTAAINNAINLTDAEKARLEDVDLYDFNVAIDGAPLEENFSAPVSVTIPYTLKTFIGEDGNEYTEDKEGIVIWFVGTDGTIEKITNVVYNENEDGTGSVTFLAPHFSMYAVAYEETPEMQCRRGYHAWKAIGTVDPSCTAYGFTVYECDTCLKTTIDNLVEKKNHTYGDVLDPTPTCEQGDFYHRICSTCGDRVDLVYRYVRALGHELDQLPGCSNGSVCARCEKTVHYPLGHNWGEWRVVIQPGDFTKGLKARYCLRCGLYDSAEIASNGTVSNLGYETYEEMVEAIYDALIGMDNGIIEMSFTMNGMADVTLKITINQNADGLLAGIEYVVEYSPEMEMAQHHYEGTLIYRNGVLIYDVNDSVSTVDYTTLESLVFMPLNVMLTYMEAIYDVINPYAEQILPMARAELVKYLGIAGDSVNSALKAAGCKFTAEELLEIFDAIESLYTYVSLKLGYDTNTNITENFELPTRQDILTLLEAVMEMSEDGENTVYTVNIDKLVNSVRTVIDWIYDRFDVSVAEVIFELIGDKLAALDESITDIDALIQYLETNIPGTLTVADAIAKLEAVLAETEVITLDEIYEIINAVMSDMYGQEFDVEVMLEEYYGITINELVTAIMSSMNGSGGGYDEPGYDQDNSPAEKPGYNEPVGDVIEKPVPMLTEEDYGKNEGNENPEYNPEENPEYNPEENPEYNPDKEYPEGKPEEDKPVEEEPEYPTAEELYQMLGEQAKGMMFGDLPMLTIISVKQSIREYFTNIKNYLDVLEIKSDFSITVDKDGKLVSLTVDEFVNAVMPGEEEGTTETQTIQGLTIKVNRDDTVKVVIPERFGPVDFDVMTGYDEDGNLVISGIPNDFDVDAELHGAYDIELKDILVLDTQKSAELGYNVYTLPKDMWDDNKFATSDLGYVLVDGKYYTYTSFGINGDYVRPGIEAHEHSLAAFVSNPYSIIPEEGTTPDYYYEGNPVYVTAIGFMSQFDGEWWVCYAEFGYEKEKGENIEPTLEYLNRNYSFDQRFGGKTVMLSSVSRELYDYDVHTELCNVRIIIRVDSEEFEYYGISDSDGITLAYCTDSHNPNEPIGISQCYILGEQVDISGIQYDQKYERTTTIKVVINGEIVDKNVTFVSFARIAPEYYVQVAPGVYRYYGHDYDVNVEKLEKVTLTDGNVIYLIGEKPATVIGRYEGTVYYGYVKIADSFVRAYYVVENGVTVEISYEHAMTHTTVSYDDAFDVKANMTRLPDGTVVIAKSFVDTLKASCTGEHMYVGLILTATKTVGEEKYTVSIDKAIKYNAGEIVIGPTVAERRDNFYMLFDCNDGNEYISYIDENGNLVLQFGTITNIGASFKEIDFPADSFLEYDEQESEKHGYNIYTYSYQSTGTYSLIYKNGKYYKYDWHNNHIIETMGLDAIVKDNWYISDVRYRYDIYPNDTTPEELHNVPVYDMEVCFLDNNNDKSDLRITLFAIVIDGEIKILTGAKDQGESLLTFEGYVSPKEYFNSLTITAHPDSDYTMGSYINGYYTQLRSCEILLTEPTVNGVTVTKSIRMTQAPNGEYITHFYYIGDILVVLDEYNAVAINPNHEKVRTYNKTYCNGTFTFAEFRFVDTFKYLAIKIGDYFYDFDDFRNSPVLDEDRFQENMYDTQRYYRVEDEYGNMHYYSKFHPSDKYFEVSDEVDPEYIPDTYNSEVIGYTEEGRAVVEIWFYVDESNPDNEDMTVITLSDGSLFYHINGQGYIKFGENKYIRAVIITDDEGNTSALCIIRRAFVREEQINGSDMFERYLSFNGVNKVVIPNELIEIMASSYGECYFVIETNQGDFRFDYYSLADAFARAGYDGDFEFGGENNDGKDEEHIYIPGDKNEYGKDEYYYIYDGNN